MKPCGAASVRISSIGRVRSYNLAVNSGLHHQLCYYGMSLRRRVNFGNKFGVEYSLSITRLAFKTKMICNRHPAFTKVSPVGVAPTPDRLEGDRTIYYAKGTFMLRSIIASSARLVKILFLFSMLGGV